MKDRMFVAALVASFVVAIVFVGFIPFQESRTIIGNFSSGLPDQNGVLCNGVIESTMRYYILTENGQTTNDPLHKYYPNNYIPAQGDRVAGIGVVTVKTVAGTDYYFLEVSVLCPSTV